MSDEATPLDKMAATPERITLQGREYTVSPLDVSAFAEMEKWLKDAPLRQLRQQLEGPNADLISTTVRDKLAYEAAKEGARTTLASNAGQKILQSFEGVQFVFWLCLRKGHPELEQGKIFELITLENFKKIGDTMDRVSGVGEVASGESSAATKQPPTAPSTGEESTAS